MSFYSLLFLGQALGAVDHEVPTHIAIVTNSLYGVAGEPILHPSRALIAGPSGVIARELPDVGCTNIDVEFSDADSIKMAAAQIVAELEMRSNDSPVAYRKNRRWGQTFARARNQTKHPIVLNDRAVYLITGGLGGIGLTLAESIARSVSARLVLLGRREFPHRESWDEWLDSHDHDNATSLRIRKVRAIEETGAEILVVMGDVCDPMAMQRVADQIHARFGPIAGIIHAAGVMDDTPLLQKDRTSAGRVLAPKVRGTLVLESVFQEDSIDFFVLMSSVSSHSTPAGQIDYAAANAFLDSFARSKAQNGTRYISIQWPRWNDVGMVADRPNERAHTGHPLLGYRTDERTGLTSYSTTLDLANDWIVSEHRLKGGVGLFPATGYLEIVRAAVTNLTGSAKALTISDFYVSQPLRVRPGTQQPLRLLMRKQGEGYRFSAQTSADRSLGWVECASGEVAVADPPSQRSQFDLDVIQRRCGARTLGLDHAPQLEGQERHIQFGARWRNLVTVRLGRDEALSLLELPSEFASEVDTYLLHPALLDMATGSAMFLIDDNHDAKYLYVPVSYGSITLFGNLPAICYAYARAKSGDSIDSPLATFDISILDREGYVVAEIADFAVRQIRDLSLLESTSGELAKVEESEGQHSRQHYESISSIEGARAFERVLANPLGPEIVIFPSDFSVYLNNGKRDGAASSETEGGDQPSDSNDDVEATVMRWWKELLGVDKVGIRDNFFDLGGQSLMGVRLLAKIKKTYGVDLKLATLFSAPTIEKLCALVSNQTKQPSAPSQMSVTSRPFEVENKPHSGLLSQIRRGGPRNLFLVHDGEGEIMLYLNLARRMPDDLAVFGIEPRRVARVPLAHVSIEEMAAFYVEEIRRKQPYGPYLLGGMCAGGVIAYEMASQLVRSGESVELVAILDAILPGIQERPGRAREERLDRLKGTFAHTQNSDVGFLKRAGTIIGAVSQKLLNTLLWQISHRGKQLSARVRFQLLRVILSRDLEWPRLVPELTLREVYDGAAARYTPKTLSISSVVLVRATMGEGEDTPYREIYAEPSFGWAAIAPGLTTVDVDGGHTTMLQESFVDSLAEALMPYLLPKAAPTVREHELEVALI